MFNYPTSLLPAIGYSYSHQDGYRHIDLWTNQLVWKVTANLSRKWIARNRALGWSRFLVWKTAYSMRWWSVHSLQQMLRWGRYYTLQRYNDQHFDLWSKVVELGLITEIMEGIGSRITFVVTIPWGSIGNHPFWRMKPLQQCKRRSRQWAISIIIVSC